ncbi:MAG: hypothetical protein Sapg2KO_11340 [Saprospiraceae bacterium]
MERISGNQTLFLKFFVPVFWIVFFGAFTLASLFFKFNYVGNIPAIYFRIGVVFFYISGLLMFVFTLMRLVRVEMGPDSIYVTNYFKHVQYPFSSVSSIEVSRFAFLKIGVVQLKEKGLLGQKLNFVVNTSRLEDYWEKYPEVRAQLVKQD